MKPIIKNFALHLHVWQVVVSPFLNRECKMNCVN
jgi:putative component of membrane protein insertase Oxa1/YidC/SpoIIIJ protein YidD